MRRQRRDSLGAAIAAQIRSIEALMVRDLMVRFGRGNLGFLWILVEPMILTIGVLFIWTLAKGGQGDHGVGIVFIVFSGYMPITLWRHMTNHAIFGLRRNGNLLYHRNVTLLDAFASRMLLEFAGTTTALIVIGTALISLELLDPVADYRMLILSWLILALYSFGGALLICVLTEYAEAAERFIGPFQYLMLPLSGCFFMVDWLPTPAQSLIWYNPITHCFEAFRTGLMGATIVTHYDLWYPLVWGIAMVAIGFRSIEAVRDRIHFG